MARLVDAYTIALLASVVSYGSALAETVASHLKIKGDAALATFTTTDPFDPCIETDVNVTVQGQILKESPGERVNVDNATLLINQFNICTGFPIFIGFGFTDIFEFQLAGNLSSASFSAIVPVVNEESNTFDFEVDLTWTATGRAVRTHFHEQFRDGETGLFINAQLRGVVAPAVATGTVVGPVNGLVQDLTPDPSISAELMTEGFGSVTIETSFP